MTESAAAKERAKNLKAKADHERSLAIGALTYDMDGWLNREEQQKRHDEFKANAMKMEREAENIIASLPKEWK